MLRPRTIVALLVAAALPVGAVLGCGSDTDPNYGPPQGIRGREIDFGIDAAGAPIPEAAPSTKTATELFADLFGTLTDATTAKGSTCLPCHGTTQVPLFMQATAEDTRKKFLELGYQDLTKGFFVKGQHSGSALTANQKTITQQWAAAEKAGGGGG